MDIWHQQLQLKCKNVLRKNNFSFNLVIKNQENPTVIVHIGISKKMFVSDKLNKQPLLLIIEKKNGLLLASTELSFMFIYFAESAQRKVKEPGVPCYD